MATYTPLNALPIAVHTAAQGRLNNNDVVQFESVLDAADAAVAASMAARRTAGLQARAAGTEDSGESAEALHAVLTAVAAITSATSVPDTCTSKRELVRWTLATIKE